MNDLKDKVDMLSGAVVNPDIPELSTEETKHASMRLFKPLYKAVVRVKVDPLIADQEYGLFSFTPARGVQPNQYGIFGTAKLRGNYRTDESAATAADNIIRYVDSVNEIYCVKVGQEFPLTKETKFTEQFDTVDLTKEVTENEVRNAQEVKKKDRAEIKKGLDREKKLLSEHKQILDGTYEEDPLDIYIRAQVKRSQLKWTLESTLERIEKEIKPALNSAVQDIKVLNQKYPHLRGKYLEHYLEARKEAGLETEFKCDTGTQMDFMKYLNDDED